jgi:hypothetical protein
MKLRRELVALIVGFVAVVGGVGLLPLAGHSGPTSIHFGQPGGGLQYFVPDLDDLSALS